MADQDVKIRLSIEGGNTTATVNTATEAFKRLGTSVREASGLTGALSTGMSNLNRDLAQSGQGAEQLAVLVGNMNKLSDAFNTAKNAAAGYLAFNAIKKMTNDLIDAQVHFQQIRYTLQAATGSVEGANEEFEFLSKTSQRLGVSLEATSETYGTFLVSAKAAHVSLKQTHDLFLSVSEASTVFHLSQGKVHSAMVALEQMMAQGVIRTQELRMQLGNAIPGAYENFMNRVKARGVDFNKAMADGALDIKTYVGDLTAAISDSFKKSDVKDAASGLNSEIARMKNLVFGFKASLSGGIFEESAAETIRAINDIGTALTPVIAQMGPWVTTIGLGGGAFLALSRAMGETVGKFASWRAEISTAADKMNAYNAEQLRSAAAAEAQALAAARQVEQNIILAASEQEVAAMNLLKQRTARDDAAAALQSVAAKEASALAANELVLAEQRLRVANAAVAASEVQLERATMARTAAQGASAVAAGELAAAQAATAAATAKASVQMTTMGAVMSGLKSAGNGLLAMLGGWPGLALAAVTAIGYLVTKETEEEKTIKKLTEAYEGLEKARTASQVRNALPGAEAAAEETKARLENEREEIEAWLNTAQLKVQNRTSVSDQQALDLEDAAINKEARLKVIDEELAKTQALIESKKEIVKIEEFQEGVQANISKALVDIEKQEGEIANIKKKVKAAKEKNDEIGLIKAEAEAAREKLGVMEEELSVLAQLKDEASVRRGLILTEEYSAAWEKIRKVEDERIRAQMELDRLENARMAKGLRKEVAGNLKEMTEQTMRYTRSMEDMTPIAKKLEDQIFATNKAFFSATEAINKKNEKNGGYILSEQERTKALKAQTDAYVAQLVVLQKMADHESRQAQKQLYKSFEGGSKNQMEATKKVIADTEVLRAKNARDLDAVERPAMDAHLARVRDLNKALEDEVKAIKNAKAAQDGKRLSDEAQKELIAEKTALTNAQIEASKALALEEAKAEARAGRKALADYEKRTKRDMMGNQLERAKLDRRDEAKQMVRNAGYDPNTAEYNEQLEKTVKLMEEAAEAGDKATLNANNLAHTFGDTLGEMLSIDFVEAAKTGFDKVLESWGQMLQKMVAELIRSQILKMVNKMVNEVAGGLQGASSGTGGGELLTHSGGGSTGAHSHGGYISGPGSATSDSIPARLSHGEYVVQASAVQHYGVSFLDALNNLNARPPARFAAGGFVGKAGDMTNKMNVNVINATGQPTRTEANDADKMVNVVVGKVADSIRRNGPVGKSIQSTFGSTRQGKK